MLHMLKSFQRLYKDLDVRVFHKRKLQTRHAVMCDGKTGLYLGLAYHDVATWRITSGFSDTFIPALANGWRCAAVVSYVGRSVSQSVHAASFGIVITIETKVLCLSSSNLVDMIITTRGWPWSILVVKGQSYNGHMWTWYTIQCIFIRLSTHDICHDPRMNPIKFQGSQSKVKVIIGNYESICYDSGRF